ncbi:MAG: hypothetical protein K2O22_05000 [Anaeroplasmataceae bacterium]|nr:hypothetical protein [Anaeroplasmataceae bacterium]
MKRFHPVRYLLTAAGILGLFFVTACDNEQSNNKQTQTSFEEGIAKLEAMITDTTDIGTTKKREAFYAAADNLKTLATTEEKLKTINNLEYLFLQIDYAKCFSNAYNSENIRWSYFTKLENSNSVLETTTYTVLSNSTDGDRFISSKTAAGQPNQNSAGYGDISSIIKISPIIDDFKNNNAVLSFSKSDTVILNYTKDFENGKLTLLFINAYCEVKWIINDERGTTTNTLSYKKPTKSEISIFEELFDTRYTDQQNTLE